MKVITTHFLSRIAIACLVSEVATAAPLAWQDGENCRFAEVDLNSSKGDQIGFTLLSPQLTGITFTNALSEARSVANRNLLSGAGLAAGDVDGDGLCDLYFCGLDSDNRLYRNLGDWRFEDITESAGVGCAKQDSTGATLADVDGDGDLDLLVNSLNHGTRLFRNNGVGRFEEVTTETGLASDTGAMSFALADVDGDQDVDLYVVNYRPDTILDKPTAKFQVRMVASNPVVISVDGRPTTDPDFTNRFELSPTGVVIESGQPDVLYLNDGKGNFAPVSWTEGAFLDEAGKPLTEPVRDWGLSARFYDFSGDGAPDLYVCNDLHPPDRIWINDGAGRFRMISGLAIRHTSTFSMGVDFGDLNRDGHADFYVADMVSREPRNRKIQIAGLSPVFTPIGLIDSRPQYFQNTFQVNRGDTTFAEVAYYAGLEASEWSWHPVFLDVDLDGYEDILVPNGQLRDFQNADLGNRVESEVARRQVPMSELLGMFSEFPSLHLPNLLFRNQGDLTFHEQAAEWGFDAAGVSQGMALADLDNDGDLDAIQNNLDAHPNLLRNNATAPRIAVRLEGTAPNTRGVGGKIRILGGPVTQSQEISCGGRFLSSDEPLRVFAAGTPDADLQIEVTWRNGTRTIVHHAKPNRIYSVSERAATLPTEPAPVEPRPFFEDVSQQLAHRHPEQPFNDFGRQLLAPNMMSQLGPGVTWADLDQDQKDDLLIGSGRGAPLGVFQNQNVTFRRVSVPPLHQPVARDTTTFLPWLGEGSDLSLLVGSSNFEDGQPLGPAVIRYDLKARKVDATLPGRPDTTGPLSQADIDGDGDLDLFVGGRCLPGRYPEPASSLVFLNQQGRLAMDSTNNAVLKQIGLVSGSVFSDLDNDGDPDLVLACEWGPVRVFRNERGRLSEITRDLGLAEATGWWNGVTTGDFNGDGLQDILASNWGLNTRYRASPQHPRRVYYGDFLGNGMIQIFETLYDPYLDKEVPDRDLNVLSIAMPPLRERYPSHAAYASESIEAILGERADQFRTLEVTTLASTLFLNRGDRFEAHALPPEAQFAPAFGISVADFDGDGHEDAFLSQNFYPVQPFSMRNDAGRGLWLRGDGQGGFGPVPGQESGVMVYGDQRGCAVSDYDRDGRIDLVVTQNGAETKLFHNVRAKPGLRVQLQGLPPNPTAIGAVIRLITGTDRGPAREIHAGAGYWSVDSPVQVMASPGTTTAIEVRWPGGATTTTPIAAGAKSIRLKE